MADMKVTRFWQDSINLLLGLWLIISPWIAGFATSQVALWNAVILGVVIAAMSLAALTRFRDWEEWADMLVGAWLIASPWVLGFATMTIATYNVVLVGIATLVLAGWSLREHRASMA